MQNYAQNWKKIKKLKNHFLLPWDDLLAGALLAGALLAGALLAGALLAGALLAGACLAGALPE